MRKVDNKWIEIRSVVENITEYMDSGLDENTEYNYRIRAFNSVGNSDYSNITSVTTSTNVFNANVIVKRNNNTESGVTIEVDKGSGFQYEGETDTDGKINIQNLKNGYKIKASKKIYERSAVKDGHDLVDNKMYELWLDSAIMQSDGSYETYTIKEKKNDYTLLLSHPIFKYNMVVSIQNDVDSDYFDKLESGFSSASTYLYDVSDGQAMFNNIAIYDDKENWNNADLIILPDEWPNAVINGLYSSGFLSSPQIRFGEKWSNASPDQSTYFTTIIHEFGHYAFGFYDEYINGVGLFGYPILGDQQESWNDYRNKHPNEIPNNYGLMDSQYSVSEMSSSNDYLKEYPIIVPKWTITMQLAERKMSCWDWMKETLENQYNGITIITPPYGWFENGQSTSSDREGPFENVGLGGDTIIRRDKNNGSKSQFVVNFNGIILTAADVYRFRKTEITYLGKTDLGGKIDVMGLKENDTLRVFKTLGANMLKGEIVIGRDLIYKYEQTQLPTKRNVFQNYSTNEKDINPPGVICTIGPTLVGNILKYNITLLSDETLKGTPTVESQYGKTRGAVNFVKTDQNKFEGQLDVNTKDPDFDGTTILSITAVDESNNVNNLVSRIKALPITKEGIIWLKSEFVDLFIDKNDISSEQLATINITSGVPHSSIKQGLYIIGEMFSVRLSQDNTFPSRAGLNVRYKEEDVNGIDQNSISLYQWDSIKLEWKELEGVSRDFQNRIFSVLIRQSGLFALFAKNISNDAIPPGKINDLGALTGKGQGEVILTWTANGDDGGNGAASYYVIKYNSSEINDVNWDSCYVIPSYKIPKTAGSIDTLLIKLPISNTKYYFAIKSVDEVSNISPLSNLASAISGISKVDTTVTAVDLDEKNIPNNFSLSQNYPNPFNTGTTIEFELPENSNVKVEVFNILGQRVKELISNTEFSAGRYKVFFDAKQFCSGVYFYKIIAKNFAEIKKMVLLK